MDTSEEYNIRLYVSGEEEEIVDLLSMVFSEWRARGKNALAHWRWMYQDNPLGPCNVAVAVKDDEIVGVSHDLHFHAKVGNEIMKTLYGMDVAVHPKHRRRGIHNRMSDFRKSHRVGFGFQYGYSTNKILIDRDIRKRQEGDDPNYLFPVDVNRYLFVRDVDLHLDRKNVDNPWIKKQGYNITKFVSKMKSTFTGSNTTTRNVMVHENRDFSEAESLWGKIQSKYQFIAWKNRAYLDWRFSDPRSGDYKIYSAHEKNKYCGYVVASIDHETPDYPMGNIVDCLTIGDAQIEKMLLREALAWLEDNDINAVNALAVKGSRMSNILESLGFIDRGDSLYCVYKIPSKIGETHPSIEKIDVNSIHLTYSDFYVK